ncbi:hypothetical protein BC830DRAFT_362861 [Chytriomyces sp. MP71]|nr:hypothetical protein BC830DRAFT_362861 [Chytriomyces sp. MP71]
MWSNRISHFHLHPPPIMTSTVPPTPSHATMATHSQDSSGAAFDIAARRFFVQLSLGCGEAKCGHNLCASNPQRKKLGGQAAAIMAVQLASSYLSQDTSKLCLRIRIIPVETIQQSHSPFLDSLLVSAKYSLLSKPRMGRSASDAALPGSTLPSSEKHASPLKDTSAPDSSASIASQYKSTILCPCPAAGETATAPNDAEFARAKSLMDLPALFSATLPTFSGVKSVAGGTGAHAVEDSASPPVARSSQMKVRQLEKMGSSMSSLFEEMDAEVLSDHLDLSILETAVGRMKDSQAQQPSVANGAMHLTKETLSLLRTIKTVFSGANALNASFLHSEFDVESEDLGLDLHSLRKSFSIMLELVRSSFTEYGTFNAILYFQ